MSNQIKHPQMGIPHNSWPYTDKEGNTLFHICRWDTEDKKKILPYCDNEWKGYKGTKPLYNLPELVSNPAKPILIVEGEKTLDKAQEIFSEYIVTTSSHGSNAYKQTDWSILQDRKVFMWRDNDSAGSKYIRNIARELKELGNENVFNVFIPKDFPHKWDLADETPDGYLFQDLKDLLDKAKPFDVRDLGLLKALTATELASMEIPPINYILEPLIAEKSLNMVFAPRGLGKTWFSLGIACAIASGGEYLKWKAPKESKVLYLDGEMPLRTIQERIKMFPNGANDNLKILSSDYHLDGFPPIATEEADILLEEHIQWADCIVLDNLATLYPNPKQNDVEGWHPIQEWLLSLRRRQKSVLLVHHSGKNGAQRGSSAKEDILDVSISLEQPADYDPTKGVSFDIKYSKARGLFGEDAKSFNASMKDGIWEYGNISSKKDEVFRLDKEGLSQTEISKKLGIPKSNVSRWLKDAK